MDSSGSVRRWSESSRDQIVAMNLTHWEDQAINYSHPNVKGYISILTLVSLSPSYNTVLTSFTKSNKFTAWIGLITIKLTF